MNRLELLQKSSILLGRSAHEVKLANAMGHFDINKVAEDFLTPILSKVFDCPNLQNQNRIRMNFPAVDLGCRTSRISIQVTSDPSSKKIIETLKKFKSHNLKDDFDKLYIFVVTEKQDSYQSKKLAAEIDGLEVDFDPSVDIFDYHDVAAKLGDLSLDKIQLVHTHLEEEFAKADANLLFRENLEKFLEISQEKIEIEKKTKKYIPSLFVETSTTKEEMRYFANPMFFYRKIDDDISRIRLSHLNELLELAKMAPIAASLESVASLDEPEDLSALQSRLIQQRDALRGARELLAPFSYFGDREVRFEPDEPGNGYWEVFRHPVQTSGSGIDNALDKVIEKIELAQAKIFLITSMAGQGKTNFVCDIVENQFKSFDVPSIFVPARALNDYPGPNRILAYIKNNRFAPDIRDLHELLKLLDSVADENKKPFVIAIDGINEIGQLDEFCSELRILMDAVCQYDFVKVLITCRSEFFDHKFSGVFEGQISDHVHRVQDLRSNMSEDNSERLLNSYILHFNIKLVLSNTAEIFLKSDLILLRIFCEIHEDTDIGYVSDIYKGDIFEAYLTKKIKDFPPSHHQAMLRTIYKICTGMLDTEDFSHISVADFGVTERQIIEQLIGEDIVLRREVPSTGLSSIGSENISFTYDELRDFILAYFAANELLNSDPGKLNSIFHRIPILPIYEGFFRYSYILARKQNLDPILSLCESSCSFLEHYVNNLRLLPAYVQNEQDVERVRTLLSNSDDDRKLRSIAWFLFRRRNLSEPLNVQILVDHVNGLNDSDSERFFAAMFSRSTDYGRNTWRDWISNLLKNLIDIPDDQKADLGAPALAFALHLTSYARWEEQEAILNCFAGLMGVREVEEAIAVCRKAIASNVRRCIVEITASRVCS